MKGRFPRSLAVALTAALVLVVTLAPVTALAAGASAVNVYRMYNRFTGEHLYTVSATERNTMRSNGWTYEGVGWQAPSKSDTPVYRLYNPYAAGGDHHYTTSREEYDSLRAVGWKQEGIAFYSADEYPNGDPILRQYNPFAVTGAHNFTASRAERDSLKDSTDKPFGWTPGGSFLPYAWLDEGIAWYGVKGSTGENYDVRPCSHIIVRERYVDENGNKWAQCIICDRLFGGLA